MGLIKMTFKELENYSPDQWFYETRDQLKRFVYKRSEEAFAAGDRARDNIKTIEQLEARRTYMREKLIESVGGLPNCDSPLNPQITGRIEEDGFHIEKIIFESRPNTYVTANMYIPDDIDAPSGAVLFLCSHSEKAKHDDEYQIVCRYLVKAGLVVLALDPIGQGERLSYYEKLINSTTVNWGTAEHDYAGSQCWPLGDGIARYFIHDAMRGIDYLCTRPEVDPARIGITGNSGGGTQTSLLMVCDPRVAAAAPATFIMNRRTYLYTGGAQDSEQIWPGMTEVGFDHEDILMAMAPRPVLVLAASSDFFPIEGTRKTFERVQRFCKMYGRENDLLLFTDNSDHHYTRAMAKTAARFFSHHLLGKSVSVRDDEIKPIDPSLLWCTPGGQIRGVYENARTVYEENFERTSEKEKMRNSFNETEKKERALKWLKDKVYYSRKPCELNPRSFLTLQVENLIVQTNIWWSQEGIFNYGLIFRDYRFSGKTLPVTVAVWDGGTSRLQAHSEWIRKKCSQGRAVLVVDVTGEGNIMPNGLKGYDPCDFYGIVFKLCHDLMWLNDSIAAMRIYDLIRTIDFIDKLAEADPGDIEFYAHGRHGVYAEMASVLDGRIKKIEVEEGMHSYTDWVKARYYNAYDITSIILPGILNYFDLPDLRKWIEG